MASISESLTEIEMRVIASIPKATDNVADEVIRHIKDRTVRRNRDLSERTFRDYSPATMKRYKGRLRPVTLVNKGDMMNSIYKKKMGQNGVRVTMPLIQSHKARRLHLGTKNMPARPFWGVTLRAAGQMRRKFGSTLEAIVPTDRRFTVKIDITT